jgi:hypothetical protein
MSIGLDGLGRLAYVLKREGDRSQDLQRTPPMDSKPSALSFICALAIQAVQYGQTLSARKSNAAPKAACCEDSHDPDSKRHSRCW